MLTSKQKELLLFIHERIKQDGVSPSFDEMKEALNLASKSGIHRLITALEERGFIKRLANRARALEVLKLPDSATPAAPPRGVVVRRYVEVVGLVAEFHRQISYPPTFFTTTSVPRVKPYHLINTASAN